MKDPARWRDPGGGADAETRALLRGDDARLPSDREREQIWSSLAPQVQALPAPPHAAPAPTAAAGSGVALGKVALGVALAVSATVGWYAIRPHEPAPRPMPEARGTHVPGEQPATIAAPTVAPNHPAPLAPATEQTNLRSRRAALPSLTKTAERSPSEPASSPPSRTQSYEVKPAIRENAPVARPSPLPQAIAPPAREAPSAVHEPAASPLREVPQVEREVAAAQATPTRILRAEATPLVVSNELLEESRTLARARAALRARDPAGALRLLQGTARTAALAQEREALTIEALAARPKSRTAAAERARAFLVAYPDSPYRARIKAVALDEP